ncbi:hypothetical protein MED222_05595 [Vibrio sp. MED222]|nr:hypothetical protein MED222_05595 [Vibrio sp. MED222]
MLINCRWFWCIFFNILNRLIEPM